MLGKKPVSGSKPENYPSYRTRLFLVITLIFFVFIVLISCTLYFFSINQVITEFTDSRQQAEKTFVSSAILTEVGIETFDAQYDFLLHDRMIPFIKAYEENRQDPSLINLNSLKTTISSGVPGEIELFMINKSGVVEYTTYERDKNMDFSQYPDFFSSLSLFLQGDEFKSDPWTRDFYDPKLYWKYGYHPTSDHEYILELGLRNDNYSQMHKKMLSSLKDIIEDAMNIQNIVHVEVYDKAYRKQTFWTKNKSQSLSSVTGVLTSEELTNLLNQTFESKKSFVFDNPQKNQVISIQYVDLSPVSSLSGSERSFIGILIFSREKIEEIILYYQVVFIVITIISLILGLIIAQYLSVYISRPITMMTEDIGIIASSSLTHSVRATGIHETEMLRHSINQMVASISEYIAEIETQKNSLENELFLREKAEKSLASANKRLTQLSQITRHDVLNQVTSLQLYLGLIPDLEDRSEISVYAERALNVVKKITQLLSFTYDNEKIGEDGAIWQNIGEILDQSQAEFSGRITIIHSCQNLEIKTDRLIKKVFYNLIDNTIRHGKTADRIWVSFEENDSGSIVYQDNGIGIPDDEKKKIFNRGYGKGTGIGMAFIKEVLESNDIQIIENGTLGHGVRFEIIIPKDHYRIIQKMSEN
ncbi:MAG: HAMP domain-containing histidine kinase [Methanomicrobiales archaeon]|nr:HAMP domain-containing histidine kinase [Methanomicrobiales archaeon]